MSINIIDERNNKRDNFIDNLQAFYQKYQECKIESNNLDRTIKDNAICLARRTAESFCRFIILDSNKIDSEKQELLYEKDNKNKKTLGGLKDALLKKENFIISDETVKKHLRIELEMVLTKGNNGCHDNDDGYATTQRDLEKVYPIILDLSDFILGKRTTNLLIDSFNKDLEKSPNPKREVDSVVISGDIKGVANAGSGSVINQTF